MNGDTNGEEAMSEGPKEVTPKVPPRSVRVGIVGLGGIARSTHLPALAALQNAGWPITVTAVADPSEVSVAAAHAAVPGLLNRARSFLSGTDLLEAANETCDAVLLLTPPAATVPLLYAALSSTRVPTFTEKPVSENTAALAELTAAFALGENVPTVQVGYNRRSQPFAPRFRERLNELLVSGSPVHIEAHLWRANRRESIFYRDTMIHAVDFLLYCLGSLTVERVTVSPPLAPGALSAGLHIELRREHDGQVAHLDVRPAVGRDRESYAAYGVGRGVELCYPPVDRPGTDATASLRFWDGVVTVEAEPEPIVPLPPNAPLLWTRGFLGQMAAFIAHDAGGEIVCGLPEALASRALTDAILSFTE